MSTKILKKLAAMQSVPPVVPSDIEKLKAARRASLLGGDPRNAKPEVPLVIRLGTPEEAASSAAPKAENRKRASPLATSKLLGGAAKAAPSSVNALQKAVAQKVKNAEITPISVCDVEGGTVELIGADSDNDETILQGVANGIIPVMLYDTTGIPFAADQTNQLPVGLFNNLPNNDIGDQLASVGNAAQAALQDASQTAALWAMACFLSSDGTEIHYPYVGVEGMPVQVETPVRIHRDDLDYLAEKIALLTRTAHFQPPPAAVLGTKCETCGELFMNEVCLRQHVDAKHTTGMSDIVRCIVCGAYFATQSAASQHMAATHSTRQ